MSLSNLELEDKLEIIGYLSVPNVISSIEATVPLDKVGNFEEEFQGKYSEEYPYTADKYGYQFRIYLNDTDGCPESLLEELDEKYHNRINDTQFIREIVNDYGFRFTKEPQDTDYIRDCVVRLHGRRALRFFDTGYNLYQEFIENVGDIVLHGRRLPLPTVRRYKKKNISKTTERRSHARDNMPALTSRQLSNLGWIGEAYIAYLLEIEDAELLNAIGIPDDEGYTYQWFNEGFDDNNQEPWDDKSVGHGCDIVITLDDGGNYYIEIKTSKREYPYFKMTSAEMQVMEEEQYNYVLLKLNNLEKLLMNLSPDIIPIVNPYKKLFNPKQMKEATFIIGGE
ncbi:protein NO VEIN domain-containing protein [Lachnospiraceae bacterium C1.1]|nr:DUF3883 domain-containing protein [Lachnospiraceae bacterium C1.1]